MRHLGILACFVSLAGVVPAAAQTQAPSCQIKRTKIVGGLTANIQNWPWQAAVRLQSDKAKVSQYFCGGTVIAPQWVLTAAHCLPEYVRKLTAPFQDAKGDVHQGTLQVVAGVGDLTTVQDDKAYAVERVVIHERYRTAIDRALQIKNTEDRAKSLAEIAPGIGDDIALLKLVRPWQGPIATLSLGSATDPAPNSDTQVRVAGFGLTEKNTGAQALDRFSRADGRGELYAGSARLLETTVHTINPQRCQSRYKGDAIGAGQVCAGLERGGKDSCQGDSGGPLVMSDDNGCPRQIGVVSWGQGCAAAQAYGVYTRVSHYADWIQKHTGSLKGTTSAPTKIASNRLAPVQLDEGLAHLESLLGATKGRVTLGIQGGNRVKLGDKVIFEATSAVAGRLLLLDIDAERKVTLIYPNQYVDRSAPGRIAAGVRVAVPGPTYPGFTSFQASEPIGKGRLLALVAPDDFDVEAFAAEHSEVTKGFAPRNDPPSYLMRVIRQIETEIDARSKSAATPSDELKRWAYAVTDYEIMP